MDQAGNVFVTGDFQSPTITFDSYTLTKIGGANIFVQRLIKAQSDAESDGKCN